MVEKWIVLSPIEDLDIETKILTIADVRFYRLTTAQMAQWKSFKKLEERGLKEFCKLFTDHVCALVEVQSVDKDAAFEKASLRIKSALDTLRIFKGKCELREPRGAVIKNKRTGKEEYSWFKAKWTQISAWPWTCKITNAEQRTLGNLTKHLEPFLRNPNSCELNRKIIRSLRWSADATQEIDEADRILKCVTALECILLEEWRDKAKLLAERVAVILTSNNANRNKIFSDIKSLYELRNCIVHGEKYQINKKDRQILDWVSRNLVVEVANLAKKHSFTKTKDVINFVNQQKGGWKAPMVALRPC